MYIFFQKTYKYADINIYVTVDMDDANRSYVAVYVCVPILIVAIFVSMLVVLYYKK